MDTGTAGTQNGSVKRFVWLVAITAAAAVGGALAHVLLTRPLAIGPLQYVLTVPGAFLAAGIILLWRHPEHLIGRLLVVGTALTMAYPALLERFIIGRYAVAGLEGWMPVALVVETMVFPLGLACLALLIGLFPTGVAATAGERHYARAVWWLPLPMLVALLANEEILVEPVAYGRFPPFPNPLHLDALAWLGSATAGMRSILASVVLVAVVMLFLRYRRADAPVRSQILWVLLGAGGALAVSAVPFIVGPFLSSGGPTHDSLILTFTSLALLFVPTTIVLAIEQPAWIDADAVIRKSFIYGALSLGIFVIYAALAASLGLVAGARLPLEVAIVVTATLAFAFQPARRRLQAVADRWVFGERPSPLEAISGLEQGGQSEDAVDELADRLARLVRTAARLQWATVSIPPDSLHTTGDPTGEDPTTVVPIARSGEQMGEIRCGPKLRGTLTAADTDLIETLAGQAALLIAHLRLTGRIVQSQEAERRRIERNIHDGAQQELIALAAKLGLARAKAREGNLREDLIAELQDDVRAIHQDLRELAQGIHPSVLTDGGLVEAVEDRCSRLPIDVVVDAPGELRRQRFPDDVEGAAYFFVTEGLANTLKHASATAATVSISRRNGDLELMVGDNGVGFDPGAIRHNGLAGLSDRIAGLAGSVTIDARPGGGVILRARIPVLRNHP